MDKDIPAQRAMQAQSRCPGSVNEVNEASRRKNHYVICQVPANSKRPYLGESTHRTWGPMTVVHGVKFFLMTKTKKIQWRVSQYNTANPSRTRVL
jgi:hypothetical protein